MSSHFGSSHYGASHYLSSHYGRVVEIVDIPEYGPGGGSSKKKHSPSARDIQIRQQIQLDDESIILVIKAFLKVINR